MLRWVMSRLDRTVMVARFQRDYQCRVLSAPGNSVRRSELGIKSDLLFELGKVLESRHSRGLRTVLIVDEARPFTQRPGRDSSAVQFRSDTRSNCRSCCRRPNCATSSIVGRQRKQRVALRYELKLFPMSKNSAVHQFTFESRRADGSTSSRPAVDYIRCTAGIPRAVNILRQHAA